MIGFPCIVANFVASEGSVTINPKICGNAARRSPAISRGVGGRLGTAPPAGDIFTNNCRHQPPWLKTMAPMERLIFYEDQPNAGCARPHLGLAMGAISTGWLPLDAPV
jgi:hypothetical protein